MYVVFPDVKQFRRYGPLKKVMQQRPAELQAEIKTFLRTLETHRFATCFPTLKIIYFPH